MPFIDRKVKALMGAMDLMIVMESSRAMEPTPQMNWLPLIRERASLAWRSASWRPYSLST